MRTPATLLALLAAGSLAAGCCAPRRCASPCPSSSRAAPPVAAAVAVPRGPALPAPGTVLDHRTGEPVAFDALVTRLATVPVVYVGEQHDEAEHHRFQARVLEALAAQPGKIALGMEMFYRPFQEHLDAYVRGDIDEAAMLEKTEWKARWGFGWEMYAPMLRFCREKKIPVVALNAPKEITRTVSRQGLDALTEEQRASLPPLDTTDMAHRAFVREAFGAHGASMPAETFERFYTAMVVWDETMASSVAQWLEQAGEGARMVVVAGNGHVADRFGIPARAARRTKTPYLVLVARVLPGPGETADDGLGRTDLTYGDYSAWFTASPKPPAPAKPPGKPAAPTAPPKAEASGAPST